VHVIDVLKPALASQFSAALEMLENAILACPDELWGDTSSEPQFWYLVHHTLFWTDCYLTDSIDAYRPPAPFGLEEFDPAGVMPPRTTTREEALAWLAHCRAKSREAIAALSSETALLPAGFPRQGIGRLELALDNLRHVQHHVAQLNLLLRRRIDSAPRWITRGTAEGGTR
jgi:hypothetical protein